MSDSFLLELDTTAPEVTFGAVTGTDASIGDVLRVGYTVDEEGVVSAEFRSSSNQAVSLDVLEDRVEGFLPPTLTAGGGRVLITTEDEVLNRRTWTLDVEITSLVSAPAHQTRRGPGIRPTAPPVRRGPQLRTSRSRPRVRSHSRASASTMHDSRIMVRGSSSVAGYASHSGLLEVKSSSRSFARGKAETRISTLSLDSVRRREGPDEEAVLLDLL